MQHKGYGMATVCRKAISAHQMILTLGLKPSGQYRSGCADMTFRHTVAV